MAEHSSTEMQELIATARTQVEEISKLRSSAEIDQRAVKDARTSVSENPIKIDNNPNPYTSILEYCKIIVPLGSAAIALAIPLIQSLGDFEIENAPIGEQNLFIAFHVFFFFVAISIVAGIAVIALTVNYTKKLLHTDLQEEGCPAKVYRKLSAFAANISFYSLTIGGFAFLLIAISLVEAIPERASVSKVIRNARQEIVSVKRIDDEMIDFKFLAFLEDNRYRIVFQTYAGEIIVVLVDAKSGSVKSIR